MGQRKYEKEYKERAAKELGDPVDTLYGWQKVVRKGRVDVGHGSHTPDTAMSLAEELAALCKQVKKLEKADRRLKEENEFLADASAFFAVSHRKSARNSK